MATVNGQVGDHSYGDNSSKLASKEQVKKSIYGPFIVSILFFVIVPFLTWGGTLVRSHSSDYSNNELYRSIKSQCTSDYWQINYEKIIVSQELDHLLKGFFSALGGAWTSGYEKIDSDAFTYALIECFESTEHAVEISTLMKYDLIFHLSMGKLGGTLASLSAFQIFKDFGMFLKTSPQVVNFLVKNQSSLSRISPLVNFVWKYKYRLLIGGVVGTKAVESIINYFQILEDQKRRSLSGLGEDDTFILPKVISR